MLRYGYKLCNREIYTETSEEDGTDAPLAFGLLVVGQEMDRLAIVLK
ncbi:MAG: hypothetical protein NTX17_08030 [Candidatus Eisenbacteria bacterium]|nr:hypothetical protein [Candidatus Eisenbacteria bacterium]